MLWQLKRTETWNCVATIQTHPKWLNKRTHLKSSRMLSFCWWNRCRVPRFASTLRKAIPDYSSQVVIRTIMLNRPKKRTVKYFVVDSFPCCDGLWDEVVKCIAGSVGCRIFCEHSGFLRWVWAGGLAAVQQSQDIFNYMILWKKYHQNRHGGGWDELPGILPGRRWNQLVKRAVATRWRTNE